MGVCDSFEFGFRASTFTLIVVWLLLFVLLADYACPLFHTKYACHDCGRDGHGYWQI